MGTLLNRRRYMGGGSALPYDAEIEYLGFQQNCSLDTGIIPSTNYKYYWKYLWTNRTNWTYPFTTKGNSGNWFIFGGLNPLAPSTIGRKKNKYCDIANVKKIRIHDFRHSHASLLLSMNVPITVISERLGHSDINMTLNTYSHMIPKDEDKAVNILNQMKQNK